MSAEEHGRPQVVALLADGMWSHDLANVIQVFADSPILGGKAPCSLVFVANGRRARLDHGLSAEATPLEQVDARADLVCVPGFTYPEVTFGSSTEQRDELDACCGWLRDAYGRGAQVASLGTGSFVLGRAGLLDGVTCTTHHAYAALFSRLFPSAALEPDRILTHDSSRSIWTSAGGASGLDLCLSLLAALTGPRTAAEVSEAMSLWRPRSLETRQEAFGMPETELGELAMNDVDTLCQAVRRDLSHPWSVREMAGRAGMSERTLQRRFLQATGETPKSWLGTQRAELAAALLEQTDLPLPLVAARVGLGSADVLYRLFRSRYGESPSRHRQRFSSR